MTGMGKRGGVNLSAKDDCPFEPIFPEEVLCPNPSDAAKAKTPTATAIAIFIVLPIDYAWSDTFNCVQ